MNPQEFDRIMSRDEEIEPEPGFLHSVMTAVRNDAAIPPRIRFPWLCVLPQLLVWCIALAWAVTDSIPVRDRMPGIAVVDERGHRSPRSASRSASLSRVFRRVRSSSRGPQTGRKSHQVQARSLGAAGRKPVSTARSTISRTCSPWPRV